MRCVILAEYLAGTPPEETASTLAAVLARATRGADADAQSAIESLAATLGEEALVSYPVRAALYMAAKDKDHAEICALLLDASPVQPAASRLAASLDDERPVTPRGRPLALGERKSLARAHRRDLLVHLTRDPHPDVVRILLGNPHLVEADVVSMAARRPAVAQALAEIAAHPRWGTRYAVKLALAQNPCTPVHLAIRVATTLRALDLQAIAGRSELAAPLREHARVLLAQR